MKSRRNKCRHLYVKAVLLYILLWNITLVFRIWIYSQGKSTQKKQMKMQILTHIVWRINKIQTESLLQTLIFCEIKVLGEIILSFLKTLIFWSTNIYLSRWYGNRATKNSNEMFIDEKQKISLFFKVRNHTSSPFPCQEKMLKPVLECI